MASSVLKMFYLVSMMRTVAVKASSPRMHHDFPLPMGRLLCLPIVGNLDIVWALKERMGES